MEECRKGERCAPKGSARDAIRSSHTRGMQDGGVHCGRQATTATHVVDGFDERRGEAGTAGGSPQPRKGVLVKVLAHALVQVFLRIIGEPRGPRRVCLLAREQDLKASCEQEIAKHTYKARGEGEGRGDEQYLRSGRAYGRGSTAGRER